MACPAEVPSSCNLALRGGKSQMCGANAPFRQLPLRDSSAPLGSGQTILVTGLCLWILFLLFLYLLLERQHDNKAGAHHIWQLMKGL